MLKSLYFEFELFPSSVAVLAASAHKHCLKTRKFSSSLHKLLKFSFSQALSQGIFLTFVLYVELKSFINAIITSFSFGFSFYK